MRIIRIKLKPDLTELLGEIAQRYSIEDTGFAADLFCLVRNKGSGLPADSRLESMADVVHRRLKQSRPLVLLGMRKRRHVLKQLADLPYFKALCLELAATPHEAVDRLLQTFREMSRKVRQAQCLTCSLRNKCEFGKQYAEVVTNISRVIDPDYASKVHDDCPERPSIDSVNQFAAFTQQFAALSPTTSGSTTKAQAAEFEKALEKLEKAVEAEAEAGAGEDSSDDDLDIDGDAEEDAEDAAATGVGGAARGAGTPTATSTGAHFAKINEKLAAQMGTTQSILFELGRQLMNSLVSHTKGKYKPSPAVSEKNTTTNIKTTTELTSVAPSQQALDDETFVSRVAKKSLSVTKYATQEDKNFLLYVLIDVSGSMKEVVGRGSGAWGLVSRGQVASTLSSALLQRVRSEKGFTFLRFFDDGPSPMLSAKTDTAYPPLLTAIATQDFNGYGTQIEAALFTAFRDIATAKDEIREAEVLLITDGDDNIDPSDEARLTAEIKKHKIKLNTLNVNTVASYGNASEVLKRVSGKFLKVNPASLSVGQLVDLVK